MGQKFRLSLSRRLKDDDDGEGGVRVLFARQRCDPPFLPRHNSRRRKSLRWNGDVVMYIWGIHGGNSKDLILDNVGQKGSTQILRTALMNPPNGVRGVEPMSHQKRGERMIGIWRLPLMEHVNIQFITQFTTEHVQMIVLSRAQST